MSAFTSKVLIIINDKASSSMQSCVNNKRIPVIFKQGKNEIKALCLHGNCSPARLSEESH